MRGPQVALHLRDLGCSESYCLDSSGTKRITPTSRKNGETWGTPDFYFGGWLHLSQVGYELKP